MTEPSSGEKLIFARELAKIAVESLDGAINKRNQLGSFTQNDRDGLDKIAEVLERAARWIYNHE